MRIDLPQCGFHYCRFQFDGNCTSTGKYEKCHFRYLSEQIERESKKGKWIATYSDCGGDVWISWKCSNCGYVRKKGWKYTHDGEKPDALFCEMCNADMRGDLS